MAATRTIPLSMPAREGKQTSASAETALLGVYEISKLLSLPAQLETTLAGVLALLSSFLDMRNGLIALLDSQGAPEVAIGSGWSEANAKRYFERLPEQAVGQIIVTKMPLVVENVALDPLFAGFDFSEWGPAGVSYSFIGVPIKDRDQVIGTLTIDRDWDGRPHFRFDEDVRFLTMVANLIGQTVRLHRLVVRDRERLIAERYRLEKALEEKKETTPQDGAAAIVGDSPALRAVLDKLRVVARSHSTVLLRGESGTGKELFARALHDLSPRRNRPFVKINCAALPESVLESELFGHEKGAFTGAIAQRKGRFELAHGGTLFLDEIGEISPAFQAKLLRVLQEGEFERVGGTRTLKVDVRLVAATNRNLEEAVTHGAFRADLYYRINVVPIFLPPLRDRPSDVPLLACEFLRRFNTEHDTDLEFTAAALSVMAACYFPGNVRELENCVRRTATLASGSHIVESDFACKNDGCLSSVLWKGSPAPAVTPAQIPTNFVPLPVVSTRPASMPASTLASISVPLTVGAPNASRGFGDSASERERLIQAMETAGWVQAKAARLLNLTPRQIGYALRKHGIPIKQF